MSSKSLNIFLTFTPVPRSMKNPLPKPIILESNIWKSFFVKEVNSFTYRVSLWVLTNAHGCVNNKYVGFTTWKGIVWVNIWSLLGKELSVVAKLWVWLSLGKTGSLLALIEMPRWIFVTEKKMWVSKHVCYRISTVATVHKGISTYFVELAHTLD